MSSPAMTPAMTSPPATTPTMSYSSQASAPRPAALLAAVAIPLGVGAFLAASLTFTGVITIPKPNPTGTIFTPKPIDPPPPPPEPSPKVEPKTTSTQSTGPKVVIPKTPTTAPDSPWDTGPQFPELDGPIFDGPIGPISGPGGDGAGARPTPTPSPTFDPIRAKPRGNPGGWVTTRDYRSNWIRRELTGTAGFTLSIDARGRVTDCQITRSTGHSVLDGATCRLLQRRARFTPAQDASGNAVAGSFSSSVTWEIPN